MTARPIFMNLSWRRRSNGNRGDRGHPFADAGRPADVGVAGQRGETKALRLEREIELEREEVAHAVNFLAVAANPVALQFDHPDRDANALLIRLVSAVGMAQEFSLAGDDLTQPVTRRIGDHRGAVPEIGD